MRCRIHFHSKTVSQDLNCFVFSLKTKRTRPDHGTRCATAHSTSITVDTAANHNEKCTSSLTSSKLALCKHSESCSLNTSSSQRFDYQLTCTCNNYFTLQNRRCYGNPNRGLHAEKFDRCNSADRCRRHDVISHHGDAAVSDNLFDGYQSWSETNRRAATRHTTNTACSVIACTMCDINPR